MSKLIGHFINGADVADDNRPQPVYNPATGKLTKHVTCMGRFLLIAIRNNGSIQIAAY